MKMGSGADAGQDGDGIPAAKCLIGMGPSTFTIKQTGCCNYIVVS